MTRKDYVLIAAAIVATQERIRDQLPAERQRDIQMNQLRGVRRAAAHICDALAADNPTFDKGRFLKACGYGATTMNPRDPALDLRPLGGDEYLVRDSAAEASYAKRAERYVPRWNRERQD